MSERQRVRLRRNTLQNSWSAFMSGDDTPTVRDEVLSSWRRTSRLLSPPTAAAPTAEPEADPGPWLKSVHILDREFDSTMRECGLVAALTDSRGQIVWTGGEPFLLKLAEQANFAPGALWDEASMGISAISLALTSDAPATVWSAEHWSSLLHSWSCYAAPISHPVSGQRLGVLNLSTRWDNGHPLVSATAVAWAQRLAPEIASHCPVGPRPDADLALKVLGTRQITLDGEDLSLTKRQIEIILLLALRPEGISLDELHPELYGDASVGLGTLKAEVSHLRRLLGGRISRTPYRLAGRCAVDALQLLDDVRAGRIPEAVRRYRGPLLPWSESPRIRRFAHTVEVAVRDAALASEDFEPALTLASHMEDDAELVEHALRILPKSDNRRHVLHGQLAGIA